MVVFLKLSKKQPNYMAFFFWIEIFFSVLDSYKIQLIEWMNIKVIVKQITLTSLIFVNFVHCLENGTSDLYLRVKINQLHATKICTFIVSVLFSPFFLCKYSSDCLLLPVVLSTEVILLTQWETKLRGKSEIMNGTVHHF